MRRVIAFFLLIICVAAVEGCAAKPASLDLEAVRLEVEKTELFGPLLYAEGQELTTMTGIDPELVDKGVFALPALIVHSSGYVIALPAKGKKQQLDDAIQEWLKRFESTWADYLPDQYEIVCNRMQTEIVTREGTYIVIIISRDNEKVLDVIKSCLN